MYKEPKAMKEIHNIQERLYEESKHLSDSEKLKAIHREADEAKKKYGLSLKKASYIS